MCHCTSSQKMLLHLIKFNIKARKCGEDANYVIFAQQKQSENLNMLRKVLKQKDN